MGISTESNDQQEYKIEKEVCPKCGKKEVWVTLRRPPGNPFIAAITLGVITEKRCFACGWMDESS